MRYGGPTAVVAAGLLVLLFSIPPVESREESPGPYAFVGYLARHDEIGAIHWGDPTQSGTTYVGSGSPGPPREDCFETIWIETVDCVVRNRDVMIHDVTVTVDSVLNGDQPPGPIEFVSDPLPIDVFLNASRMIALDVAPQFYEPFVEIFAGDVRVAGGYGYPEYGESVTWFRLQSEVDVLYKGSVVKVFLSQDPNGGWDLAAQNGTRLAFPVYAPEEVPHRVAPWVAKPADRTKRFIGTVGAGEDSGAVLALAALGAVGFGSGRSRRRGVAAVLMVGLVVFAGCVSKRHDAEDSSTASEGDIVLQQTHRGGTAEGRASLFGAVRDPLNQSVAKALVSLIDLSENRVTDGFGRFAFENVSAGSHTLRVERGGFAVFEDEVSLKAGESYIADVHLVFDQVLVGDAAPHLHNGYGDAKMKEIYEESLTPTCGPGIFDNVVRCEPLVITLPRRHADGTPNLILPGTRLVEVRASWDESQANAALARTQLSFHSPIDEAMVDMMPHGNGEATTIAMGWDMADVGHQTYTAWSFQLQVPDTSDRVAQAQDSRPWGPIDVTITIHRGMFPYEAPHADRWGGRDRLSVFAAEFKGPAPACTNTATTTVTTPCIVRPINISMQGATLLPGDTEWLDVQLNISRPMSPAASWYFAFKGAGSPRGNCGADAYFRRAFPNESFDIAWKWRIPLRPYEADPFYALTTQWCYNVGVVEGDEQDYFMDACTTSYWCPAGKTNTFIDNSRQQLFFTLNVYAGRSLPT